MAVFMCMIEVFGVARANEMSGVLPVLNSCDEVVHLGKVSLVVISIVLIFHVLPLKKSKIKLLSQMEKINSADMSSFCFTE